MQREFHKPVLVNEVLHYLNPQSGKKYLDVTFGGGGHTRALLEHATGSYVVALDWDQEALERGSELQTLFPGRLELLWGNFSLLYKILKKVGISSVDGILADFGTSQYQIEHKAGFSFCHDTPLDMRMSPAHQRLTAAVIINKSSGETLRQIFWQLGEEKHAKQIVAALLEVRKRRTIETTKQLADIVKRVVPKTKKQKIHPATRVFQALRIYVNNELDNIRAFLPAALRVLNKSGRLVVISFHSLEDRIVKHFFKKEEQSNTVKILTPRAVRPTPLEIVENPSARSARLRALERI